MLIPNLSLMPMPVTPPPPARKRRNWLACGCGLLLLIFALPVFCCGAGMLVYILFPPAPFDVLLMGVDARPGEGLLTRADSILLLGIQPQRLKASLLSIPRDLFIQVPDYGLQRINTINALGEQEAVGRGPELLSDSIAASFGIQPDRYVRMDFDTFVALIDAVGGVTIEVQQTIVDDAYPTTDGGTMRVRFEPGSQHMDGERALIYSRTRHGDDDYQRADRQQQVISAVSQRLLNPLVWPAVAEVINQHVDTNLLLIDAVQIAPVLLVNAGRFDRLVIDRDYITADSEGLAIPDYGSIAAWTQERFD